MNISIKLLNGEVKTAEFGSTGNSVIIGRGKTANFIIHDETLSRKHALIEFQDAIFYITDLESQNGVFIDGEKIPPHTKTIFSTFQILFLGPLECRVADSENSDLMNGAPTVRPPEDKDEGTRTRTISYLKKEVSKRVPISKKRQDTASLRPLTFSILFFASVIGVFIYQYSMDSKSKKPASDQQSTYLSQSKLHNEAIPTTYSFFDKNDYQKKSESKSCQQYADICGQLNLSGQAMEGVYEENKEYIVFMKSSLHVKDEFSKLKSDPLIADMASIYKILISQIYAQLARGRISQIHLVLANDQDKIYRVYRFNRKDLEDSRGKILIETGRAVTAGNTEAFWKLTHTYIPSLDF